MCGAVALGAPPNDNCVSATPITVPGLNTWVRVQGTSVGASLEVPSGCGTDDELDVWFTFTAPVSGRWYFDTVGSLLFDTTLAAYSSCGGPQLACNNDIDALNFVTWSSVVMQMTGGDTIKLRVAGNDHDADLFTLNVVGLSSNALNSCATAEPITLNVPKGGTNMEATTDFALQASLCGVYAGSGGGSDVFYAFTPPSTQAYTISACTSNFDTVLAILRDCSGTPGSVIACNDNNENSCGSLVGASQITNVTLTGGTRYLIRLAGFDLQPADRGNYTITVGATGAGICCRGATCVALTTNNCVPIGSAGVVQRYQVLCNPQNPTTPCCHADYNKIGGITIQDIFDYLNDWFTGSSTAVTGGDGTGTPTVQHIFDYLNLWFVGC
jgi:hypothetical protein